MASPPPPSSLMEDLTEDLIEEILLRLPPEDPASLVRAAVVCKRWRRFILLSSGPGGGGGFRRRYIDLHRRTQPMLGFLCDHHDGKRSTFMRTSAASPLQHGARLPRWSLLDSRHGRVLLRESKHEDDGALVVWDPITNEQQELLFPPPRRTRTCVAAVLCAAAAAAATCDDHRGSCPFVVVFVGTDPRNMFVCTYSSDLAMWSDPISLQHLNDCYIYAAECSPAVLLGKKKKKELYFGIPFTNTALRYDLELRETETSWIQLPTLHYCYQRCVLTATEEDGGLLGLVTLTDGKLCMWLRMEEDTPEANAGWLQIKAIDLGWQSRLHADPVYLPDASVVGFADGVDVVFMAVNDALYTVDLKTYAVKMVYKGRAVRAVFPYMRFYDPALDAACLGEEPSAAGSRAWKPKVLM